MVGDSACYSHLGAEDNVMMDIHGVNPNQCEGRYFDDRSGVQYVKREAT